MTEKFLRISKGYVISLMLFTLLTTLGAVLMKITPFPESWGFYYIVAAMMVSTFFMSLYISGYLQRAGLLVGAGCAVFLLLSIIAAVSACFLKFPDFTVLKPGYLLPVGTGIAGGILGVNLKK